MRVWKLIIISALTLIQGLTWMAPVSLVYGQTNNSACSLNLTARTAANTIYGDASTWNIEDEKKFLQALGFLQNYAIDTPSYKTIEENKTPNRKKIYLDSTSLTAATNQVKAFQTRNNITSNGKIGPETSKKIISKLNTKCQSIVSNSILEEEKPPTLQEIERIIEETNKAKSQNVNCPNAFIDDPTYTIPAECINTQLSSTNQPSNTPTNAFPPPPPPQGDIIYSFVDNENPELKIEFSFALTKGHVKSAQTLNEVDVPAPQFQSRIKLNTTYFRFESGKITTQIYITKHKSSTNPTQAPNTFTPIELSFDTDLKTSEVVFSDSYNVIAELTKLAKAGVLSIVPGTTSIDGVLMDVTNNKRFGVTSKATDIGKNFIDMSGFRNTRIVEGDYGGRGTGVQKVQSGQIKGIIDSDDGVNVATELINFFLSFLGVIAVIMIVYAGFLYVTARGESEPHDKALSIITYSVIGILIILSAYTITNTFLTLGGTDRRDIRIDINLGKTTLLGYSLSQGDQMFLGTVTGPVSATYEQDMVIINSVIGQSYVPISENVGKCKIIDILSVCLSNKIK